MPRDVLDELFGCDEIGTIFDDIADTAKKIVRPVAKAASTVLKPVYKVGAKLPVIGDLVKVADAGWTQLDKTVNLTGRNPGGLLDKMGSAPDVYETPAGIATAGGPFAALNTQISRALQPAAQEIFQQETIQPPLNIQVAPYGYSRAPSAPTLPSLIPAATGPSATDIAAALEARLGGKINAIGDLVNRINIQNQATSEHKALLKQDTFQREVIASLKRIAQRV